MSVMRFMAWKSPCLNFPQTVVYMETARRIFGWRHVGVAENGNDPMIEVTRFVKLRVETAISNLHHPRRTVKLQLHTQP